MELKEYPNIGRIVPELSNDSIRERIIYSYRIVYKKYPGKILIVAIIHGKRHMDSILDRIT